jgi:hypothetical protein
MMRNETVNFRRSAVPFLLGGTGERRVEAMQPGRQQV